MPVSIFSNDINFTIMKRIIYSALAIAVIFLSACGSSKPVVESTGARSINVHNQSARQSGSAFYYSLPRTAVVVEVEVSKTKMTPGPYAQYANRLLGLNDVITRSANRYEITDIKIKSFSDPDPDHFYMVSLPDQSAVNRYLSFTESGLLLGLGSKPMFTDPNANGFESQTYGKQTTEAGFTHFLDFNLIERIDTIVEYVREDTLTLQRQSLRRSWVEKSTEQRAREVADYILELREKKFDLISGFQEISYSKEALEYMYSEMNQLESDYLDLFTGIRTKETYRYRFVHRPSKRDAGSRHILFSFSSIYGILSANDVDGRPFMLTYQRSKLTDPLADQAEPPTAFPGEAGFGIHYRIPEYADIKLHFENELIAESRMLINQFGIVSHLPAKDLEIRLDPGTGSIQSIGVPESSQPHD